MNALPVTLVLFEPWGRIVTTLSCPRFCSWAVTFHAIFFLQWYLHQTRPHIKTSRPRLQPYPCGFGQVGSIRKVRKCWDLPFALGLGWLDKSDRQMKKLSSPLTNAPEQLLRLCWPKPVVTQHRQGGKKGKRLKIYGLNEDFYGAFGLFSRFSQHGIGLLWPLGLCVGVLQEIRSKIKSRVWRVERLFFWENKRLTIFVDTIWSKLHRDRKHDGG